LRLPGGIHVRVITQVLAHPGQVVADLYSGRTQTGQPGQYLRASAGKGEPTAASAQDDLRGIDAHRARRCG